nr:RHS repeat-associated core domain-containing protein [Saprospiraceae bacterium]
HRINTDSTYLFSNTSGFWVNSPKHSSSYAYDANGNLTKLSRFGISTTSAIDSLNYYYSSSLRPNLLSSVTDNVSPTSYDDDIDNQLPGNYSYDSIGNLVSDLQSKANISWDPYQKIRKVIRNITVLGTGGSYTYDQTERFDYDPQGQRTSKKMTKSYNLDSTAHYYLRDAQGNAIAIYKKAYVNIGLSSTYIQAECNIFGSSRVGVYYPPDRSMISDSPGRIATRYRNYRRYEVSNHLGNVMSVVTDRLKGNPAALPQRVSAYEPDIVAAQDYYPFGQVMRSRNFPTTTSGKTNFPTKYRYGFNDKEADADGEIQNLTTYDYGFRIYNPGIARFLSVDPLTRSYPHLSPFAFAENNPIANIDIDGLEGSNAVKKVYTQNYGPIIVQPAVDNLRLASHPGYQPNIVKQFVKPVTSMVYPTPGPQFSSDPATQIGYQLASTAPIVTQAVLEEVAELPMLGVYVATGAYTGDFTDAKYQAAGLLIPFVSGYMHRTVSRTIREALNVAKNVNGIPKSAIPDKIFLPGDKLPDELKDIVEPLSMEKNVSLSEYKINDANGNYKESIYLREDLPTTYKDGGSQPHHFNVIKKNNEGKYMDTKQHHEVRPQ